MGSASRWRRMEHARSARGPHRRFELLEHRAMLSATLPVDVSLAQPAVAGAAVHSSLTPAGDSPVQVRSAYGFDQITFNGGAVMGDGSQQTIAIVDAFDDPNIAADLQAFDQTFKLPDPPSFTKINQTGGTTPPQANSGWGLEISLDVEWAHAIAPAANIVLVEANSNSFQNLLAAVNTARHLTGVSTISMSWGGIETLHERLQDAVMTTPAGHGGITFVASAGDAPGEVIWPSASPNVLSVGGTNLVLSSGAYGSESAWSDSGGGNSRIEPEPSYQASVQNSGKRSTPDVAYDADPASGVAVYDTFNQGGWLVVGGTSAGAPQWAALFAIADQGRALAGKSAIAGGQAAVYGLPGGDFHDITTGSNGHPAGAGYDLVTGLGTPVANLVVASLVGAGASSASASTVSSSALRPDAADKSTVHAGAIAVAPVLPFTARQTAPHENTGSNNVAVSAGQVTPRAVVYPSQSVIVAPSPIRTAQFATVETGRAVEPASKLLSGQDFQQISFKDAMLDVPAPGASKPSTIANVNGASNSVCSIELPLAVDMSPPLAVDSSLGALLDSDAAAPIGEIEFSPTTSNLDLALLAVAAAVGAGLARTPRDRRVVEVSADRKTEHRG